MSLEQCIRTTTRRVAARSFGKDLFSAPARGDDVRPALFVFDKFRDRLLANKSGEFLIAREASRLLSELPRASPYHVPANTIHSVINSTAFISLMCAQLRTQQISSVLLTDFTGVPGDCVFINTIHAMKVATILTPLLRRDVCSVYIDVSAVTGLVLHEFLHKVLVNSELAEFHFCCTTHVSSTDELMAKLQLADVYLAVHVNNLMWYDNEDASLKELHKLSTCSHAAVYLADEHLAWAKELQPHASQNRTTVPDYIADVLNA